MSDSKQDNEAFVSFLKRLRDEESLELMVDKTRIGKLPMHLVDLDARSISPFIRFDHLRGREEQLFSSMLARVDQSIDEDPEKAMQNFLSGIKRIIDFFRINKLDTDWIFEKISDIRAVAIRISHATGAYEYTIETPILPFPGISIAFHFKIPETVGS